MITAGKHLGKEAVFLTRKQADIARYVDATSIKCDEFVGYVADLKELGLRRFPLFLLGKHLLLHVGQFLLLLNLPLFYFLLVRLHGLVKL